MSSPLLMPHAVCWREDQHLIWTMAVSNAVTFLSYTTICVTLFALARRTRRIIARDWIFFVTGFALFIVACGSTHLLEVITTWSPIFWVDAWTNIITATLSAYVALQLIRRSAAITAGLNDYADRLARTQDEKAQMEESLLAAQKLEDWSRMSAAVTHEIGNPLESIQNILYLIRQSDVATNEIVRLTRMASEEADRILTISRSTLSFFRQSAEPESMDVRTAAESVRFLLDPVLRRREVTLRIQTSGELTVSAYAGELRQVLLNLVRNACEAVQRPHSTITLTLAGVADHVTITIADQGTGIPPELLPTLFQFGHTTKGAKGNGMGLWTVKHIVDKHGGAISVDSTPGQGTTFTITWPRSVLAKPLATSLPERQQRGDSTIRSLSA
jgi:signal transduction histidine kinase